MTTTPRVHWWIGMALLALGGMLGLVFIGPQTSLPVAARKSTEENVLRIVYTQALRPDPHVRPFPLSTYNHFILSLWEPLVECHPATGEPHPAAAESWSWSPDYRMLRRGLNRDARCGRQRRGRGAQCRAGWL